MSNNARIFVGDVGTKVRIRMVDENDDVLNLSLAESLRIVLRKPSGATIEIDDPELVTDGTDGRMEYETQAGDIDEAGRWRVQGRVSFAAGGEWHTTIDDFAVHRTL